MRTLRRAFENEDELPEIEFKGPLAQVCVDALRVAYAKTKGTNIDEDGDNNVVLESLEMDSEILSNISRMISTGGDAPDNSSKKDVVYTVKDDSLTDENVVDLTKEMSDHDSSGGRFFLVIDATKPSAVSDSVSNPQEDYKMLTAIETIAGSFGVPVYRSLKSFLLGYH